MVDPELGSKIFFIRIKFYKKRFKNREPRTGTQESNGTGNQGGPRGGSGIGSKFFYKNLKNLKNREPEPGTENRELGTENLGGDQKFFYKNTPVDPKVESMKSVAPAESMDPVDPGGSGRTPRWIWELDSKVDPGGPDPNEPQGGPDGSGGPRFLTF